MRHPVVPPAHWLLSPRRSSLLAAVGVLVWLGLALTHVYRVLHIAPIEEVKSAVARLPLHDARRPTAVLLLSQAGTEVTDFLAPFAILSASGVFNVYAVAPAATVVPTNGGLGILPQLTLDTFDAAHPAGADLVVIPNVLDPDNPRLVAWVTEQAAKGAVSASICEGARVLARTGLIDGRAATTHFAAVDELQTAFPQARWRNDVRYVVDGTVVMSAGVTAGIDAALYLVGRFSDAATVESVRLQLQLPVDVPVRVPAPTLTLTSIWPGIVHALTTWPKQTFAVPLYDGIDELELAATLDTHARTFAATTKTVSPDRRAALSKNGLTLIPMAAAADADATMQPDGSTKSGAAFDRALREVEARYGARTADFVAMQLQYPWQRADDGG